MLVATKPIDALINTLFDPNSASAELLLALNGCAEVPNRQTIELLSERFRHELELLYPQALLSALKLAGQDSIDTSGTGGSGLPHFNSSTSAAFVLAAAGAKVSKFGNRAATSNSGSVDFLEALGIVSLPNLHQAPEILADHGLLFLSARGIYPSAARLAPVRKHLARPTLLNIIGPLLNPLQPSYRLLGIANHNAVEPVAEYLAGLTDQDPKRLALLVRSGRLDECSIDAATEVVEIEGQSIRRYQLDGRRLVKTRVHSSSQQALTPQVNAEIFIRIISGQDNSSCYYAQLVLNAACALYACRHASSPAKAIETVAELLACGQVKDTYEKTRRHYARLSD